MQKLGLPSSKSLDKFKSLYGPASGTEKASSFSSRPSTNYISLGSFANMKLTAEKLVKEQASVKTDLEIANTKLKKSLEHVHALEEKLQNGFKENAKLKVNADGQGTARFLLDKIAEMEHEAQKSFMHRFNIAADLMDQAKDTGSMGLAGKAKQNVP
ncbi:hypothetical protein K1719_003193 [Acacia pycnantha]|nr:hypothetical protein K1719_003193 [Acacia pycnantha]